MLEFRPNLIAVTIDFRYESDKKVGESGTQKGNKGVPNEIRRAFLGLAKGTPNIPKQMQKKAKSEEPLLFPIHFSLIKKPIVIKLSKGNRRRNTGVGALILYEYFGLPHDLEDFLNKFEKYLVDEVFATKENDDTKGKHSYSLSCSGFKIIIGKYFRE